MLCSFERCSKPVFEAKFRHEVLTHTLALCLRDSRFSLRAMQGHEALARSLRKHKLSPQHHNMSLRT